MSRWWCSWAPSLVGCTDNGAERGSASSQAPAAPRLAPLHATRGTNAAILDDAGRQVRLRGVNVNSLGDYYQADPRLPPVVPVTDADWADMAKQGFNVVRLLVSWSSLEPARDVFDDAYVGRVHDAVAAAAAHGIYSVIDMHQDAWGKFIATPPGVTCAAGSEPAIGWDGAPQWATLTDGTDTCQHGSRESSEAVMTAWDSFYTNRDGIMDELVGTWAKLATSFRDDPAVAGYDLLNEPNHGHDGDRGKDRSRNVLRQSHRRDPDSRDDDRVDPPHRVLRDDRLRRPRRSRVHGRRQHRLRSAQLRRIDRRHSDRRPLRLLRRSRLAVRHRHVGRRIRLVQRPARKRGEARPLRRQGGLTSHRGRHVVAVAAGLRRPALDRQARRNARPDPDPLPAQRLPR